MTLTQILYRILENANLSVPEFWAGTAKGSTSTRSGLITFFPLPSPGSNFADNTSNTLYQFDVWHEDMYTAEEYKEELVSLLAGYAGIVEGRSLIISMDSDAGGFSEDGDQLWHYPVTFNIRYVRK